MRSNSSDRPQAPSVPPDVPVERMEKLLDRLALEMVAASDEGYKLVHIFEWLEGQIRARQAVNAAIDRARALVERQAEDAGMILDEFLSGERRQNKPDLKRR